MSGLDYYAVRFILRADREAVDALLRLEELEGEGIAREWYAGLREAAGTLAEQPRRYVVAERESRQFGQEVRRLLYRRTSGSAAYHAFYRIEEKGEHGPRVIVFHIRHSSRKPMTAREARDLRGEA